MSGDNVHVDYANLKSFYDERNEIDLKLKSDSFTTLIPPSLMDGRKDRGVLVYVTEINVDFSCDKIRSSLGEL